MSDPLEGGGRGVFRDDGLFRKSHPERGGRGHSPLKAAICDQTGAVCKSADPMRAQRDTDCPPLLLFLIL